MSAKVTLRSGVPDIKPVATVSLTCRTEDQKEKHKAKREQATRLRSHGGEGVLWETRGLCEMESTRSANGSIT